MASELGKVYVYPSHVTGKFQVMPMNPDGTVNHNVYAQARTLSFNTFEDAVKYAKGLVAHYGGTVESDPRGKSVNSRPGAKARFKVEDRFYFGKGRKERFELSFNRSEVERAKSELQSLVQVHRRLADKSEGVKAAKHQVVADVLARLVNQGPEVLAAVGFRKASYWNARAMELANASSSGYGPILKTLVSEAEREYRSH